MATLPNPNPIPNNSTINYTYIANPNNPQIEESNVSNTVNTFISISEILINKDVDKKFAQIGDILTYTIELTNTGNATANNIILTDTIPNDTTFILDSVKIDTVSTSFNPEMGINIETISPGQTITVRFDVIIDTLPDPNPILNESTVIFNFTIDPSTPSGEIGSANSNAVNTFVANANLSPLEKLVNKSFAQVGDTLIYTILLKNTGNVTANNIILSDTIPNDTTFVPGSTMVNGILNTSNPENGINVGSLAPNQITTVTFNVVVNTLPDPNPIPNSATANFVFTVDPSIPNSASGSSNSNTVNTFIAIATINSPKKFVDKEFDTFPTILTYTIELKNTGNVTANNVVLTDTIPNDTEFVANSVRVNGILDISNPENGIDIGSLAPNQITTVTFEVTVNTLPNPNPIPNSATVNFDFTVDPSVPNNVSSSSNTNTVHTLISKPIIDISDLGLVKYVDKKYANILDILTYTIALTNTGNTPANNVILTDTIPNDTAFVENSVLLNGLPMPGVSPQLGIYISSISPGETSTITFNVVVNTLPNPNPIPNSSMVNFDFTANPDFPNAQTGSGNSNIVTTQVNFANLDIIKIVSDTTVTYPQIITYTLSIFNNGNVPANNTLLTDTIPNDTIFVANSVTVNGVNQPGLNPQNGINIATIHPNQTITVTFDVLVQTVPNPNPIPNTAKIDYSYTIDPSVPNTGIGSDSSNEVNTFVGVAVIEAVKSADKDIVEQGDTLTYTIEITNLGNIEAVNILLIDTIPNNTIFVENSVTVNNIYLPGEKPQTGISIDSISPNETVTVTFDVIVRII